MAQRPSVARVVSAHPHLSLLPRDEHMAALEALERRIIADVDGAIGAIPGEMIEYPPPPSGGKVLFRYVEADGNETAFSVSQNRLTPHIRALWWELAEAIEAEGRRTTG